MFPEKLFIDSFSTYKHTWEMKVAIRKSNFLILTLCTTRWKSTRKKKYTTKLISEETILTVDEINSIRERISYLEMEVEHPRKEDWTKKVIALIIKLSGKMSQKKVI